MRLYGLMGGASETCFWRLFFALSLLFPSAGIGSEDMDLGRYRESQRLFLASLAVEMRPVDAAVVYARTPGFFSLLVESGTILKKGELWSVFNSEDLELERALLAADEKSLPEEMMRLSLARQEDISLMQEGLKVLKAEYDRLAFTLQEPEVSEDTLLSERVVLALAELGAQLGRARQKLELLEKGGIHQANVERLKLNLRRKKASFDDLVKRAEQRAEFNGVIEFLGPLSEELEEGVPRKVFVGDIEAVAVLKNEERFQIELEPLVLDFNGVNRSNLFIQIDSQKGEEAIRANFDRLVVNQKDPSKVEGWLFQVLEEDSEDVKNRSLGSGALASVFLSLGEPALLIPKADFLKHLPESKGAYRGSWKSLVKKVLPEWRLVAEGRGALAVRSLEDAQK